MTTTYPDAVQFEPVELDTVPDMEDVEYPCEVCGREAGPYGGRGRHPKRCPLHKKTQSATKRPTVTGKDANLAAQATGVLVQLNGMIALGLMALGMNNTASAIASANDTFEQSANQALLTDPDLCRLILKGGVKSAKISLGLAYGGMLFSVAPTAVAEVKVMKEARAERKANQEEV